MRIFLMELELFTVKRVQALTRAETLFKSMTEVVLLSA
jgi:hypothetical protein